MEVMMKAKMMAVRLLFAALFAALIVMNRLTAWLALYALSLLIPLLIGKRVYCMAVCPINTLMMGVQSIKKKLRIATRPMPRALAGGRWAWAGLAVTAALFIVSRRVLGRTLPVMLLWMVVAVFFTLRWHQDVFHDLLCPYGVLQRLLSRVSLLNEDNRKAARDYQGFTISVLGGRKKGAGEPGASKETSATA